MLKPFAAAVHNRRKLEGASLESHEAISGSYTKRSCLLELGHAQFEPEYPKTQSRDQVEVL